MALIGHWRRSDGRVRPSCQRRRFRGLGVGPGVMDRARSVLRRRVDRVEPKLIRPDIDEVVAGAGRDVDEPSCPRHGYDRHPGSLPLRRP